MDVLYTDTEYDHQLYINSFSVLDPQLDALERKYGLKSIKKKR